MSDANSSVLEVKAPLIAQVPVVLDSPHSGNIYPSDFKPAISMQEARTGEDAFVDELFPGPEHGAPMLLAKFPRVYIDPNRAMDDISASDIAGDYDGPLNPSAKSELGIGLIWTKSITGTPMYGAPLDATQIRQRIDTYWRPYRETLSSLIAQSHSKFGVVMHINCHSMPSIWPPGFEREGSPIGVDFVLGNRDHSTCSRETVDVARQALEDAGHLVAVNDQMKGVDIVKQHGQPHLGRQSLQIEVVRDRYLNESTWTKTANFNAIRESLGRVIDALAAHAQDIASR